MATSHSLNDKPINSVLVLRRGKESLWIQTDTDGKTKRFVTLSRVGTVDYPLLSNKSVRYDRPEDLTAPFKAMVRAHLKTHIRPEDKPERCECGKPWDIEIGGYRCAK